MDPQNIEIFKKHLNQLKYLTLGMVIIGIVLGTFKSTRQYLELPFSIYWTGWVAIGGVVIFRFRREVAEAAKQRKHQ